MRDKKRLLAFLIGILGLVLLVGACKKPVPVVPPPPPPPPPPPAPTATLTAEPSTIERGQSATLSWSSDNATELSLAPGVGTVQATGSQSVSPSDSTTYTLTAKGPGGSVTATARVTVTVPPPPPPPKPQVREITDEEDFARNVRDAFFDLDKSDIRADAQAVLTNNAGWLKSHPNVSITIEGHCDERGSEEYNLGLGDRRAMAAKNFLVNLGISADRLNTISYGKSRPQCSESTEECWQNNRRAKSRFGR